MSRLITQREAASLLSVSVRTIENYRKTGKLQTIKLGYRSIRIDRHEIEKMIEVEKWQKESRQGLDKKMGIGTFILPKTDAQREKAFGQKIRLSR